MLELGPILGAARTRELAGLAASLIGLQYYPRLAGAVGAVDGDALDAARFLSAMLEGMGDEVRLGPDPQPPVGLVITSDAADEPLSGRARGGGLTSE